MIQNPGPEEESPAPAPAAEPNCFIDRELSWLQFNLRVLREAGDPTVPLLERLKFLGIYRSNLEEFFMVRVGTLTHRNVLLPDERDEKTGWTAAEQLRHILAEVTRQQEIENKIYRGLLQDMKAAGIDVLDFRKIGKVDEVMAKKFFTELRPLLSPRVVDAGHLPPCLRVDALADDGAVMAISHRELPVFGVQFHPEAVLTSYGHELLGSFLRVCRQASEGAWAPDPAAGLLPGQPESGEAFAQLSGYRPAVRAGSWA